VLVDATSAQSNGLISRGQRACPRRHRAAAHRANQWAALWALLTRSPRDGSCGQSGALSIRIVCSADAKLVSQGARVRHTPGVNWEGRPVRRSHDRHRDDPCRHRQTPPDGRPRGEAHARRQASPHAVRTCGRALARGCPHLVGLAGAGRWRRVMIREARRDEVETLVALWCEAGLEVEPASAGSEMVALVESRTDLVLWMKETASWLALFSVPGTVGGAGYNRLRRSQEGRSADRQRFGGGVGGALAVEGLSQLNLLVERGNEDVVRSTSASGLSRTSWSSWRRGCS
jgi:hypothetical protein